MSQIPTRLRSGPCRLVLTKPTYSNSVFNVRCLCMQETEVPSLNFHAYDYLAKASVLEDAIAAWKYHKVTGKTLVELT